MEELKCGACGYVYSDYDNCNRIAGTGMCFDCNLRWIDYVESTRWDNDGGTT